MEIRIFVIIPIITRTPNENVEAIAVEIIVTSSLKFFPMKSLSAL